mmetsp:Transcript_8578/g.31726  ORF Transcript_8578/g.31726 Transcript_8578/m.31726 type:complete len:88 (-) Transcript_8578:169-432(-)
MSSSHLDTQSLLMEITKQQYLYDTQRLVTAFNRCTNMCVNVKNLQTSNDFSFEERNCLQFCTQNYVDTTLIVANEILKAQGTNFDSF